MREWGFWRLGSSSTVLGLGFCQKKCPHKNTIYTPYRLIQYVVFFLSSWWIFLTGVTYTLQSQKCGTGILVKCDWHDLKYTQRKKEKRSSVNLVLFLWLFFLLFIWFFSEMLGPRDGTTPPQDISPREVPPTGWAALGLIYKVQWPLHILFTPAVLEKSVLILFSLPS